MPRAGIPGPHSRWNTNAGATKATICPSYVTAVSKSNTSVVALCSRQISYGQMIACENPDCAIEWFHFPCVGLKVEVSNNI